MCRWCCTPRAQSLGLAWEPCNKALAELWENWEAPPAGLDPGRGSQAGRNSVGSELLRITLKGINSAQRAFPPGSCSRQGRGQLLCSPSACLCMLACVCTPVCVST